MLLVTDGSPYHILLHAGKVTKYNMLPGCFVFIRLADLLSFVIRPQICNRDNYNVTNKPTTYTLSVQITTECAV